MLPFSLKPIGVFVLTLALASCDSRSKQAKPPQRESAALAPKPVVELPAPIRGMDYQVVFEDTFDGPQGAMPNPAKWKSMQSGKWRDVWYVDDCVQLDGNGNLVISLRRNGDRVETGYIGTPDMFQATHGYFEARCKVLNTKGAWCAFWVHPPTMGDPVGDSAKAGVELDVFEYFGPHWEYKDQVRHAAHWDGYGKDHKAEGVGQPYPEITKKFCTFAMKWDEEGYVFYTDGVETGRLSKAPKSNRPQFLILSCEVEKWCGKIEEAVLPDAFTIDHVRVWQTPAQITADAKRPEILSPNRAKHLLENKGHFAWIDKNKDRKLSQDEFLHDRKDKEGGAKQFADFDKDKDTALSLEEFLFKGKKPIPDLDQAIAAVLTEDRPRREAEFKPLDKDQDGKLTREEFLALEKDKQKDALEKRFIKFDKNKDAVLSVEEFVNEGR